MPDTKDTSTIWLEVTNVRSSSKKGTQKEPTVEIQVKGDRAEREPEWWTVNISAYIDSDAGKTYRTLSDNLDKKRIVLAALSAIDSTLQCKQLRIQYAESASR